MSFHLLLYLFCFAKVGLVVQAFAQQTPTAQDKWGGMLAWGGLLAGCTVCVSPGALPVILGLTHPFTALCGSEAGP